MIAILGAGAFGSALAMALPGPTKIWGRGLTGRSPARLPGHSFPEHVEIAPSISEAAIGAEVVLIATPMKALRTVAEELDTQAPLIACCKGIDPETGLGAASLLESLTGKPAGILTGPSFAADIARGLPTALTLAMEGDSAAVQARLSGPVIRLYTSADVRGAELGGALKNVLAIAAGAVMGAGLGQSAQAALLTRGFAEITTLARCEGAKTETLMGLSGVGDMMLTAFSEGSRNYRYGLALGRGESFGEDTTVEGITTAAAIAQLAEKHGLDLPVLATTQRLLSGELTINTAVQALMSRPLKEE
ncbi:MAG: NAD(P)H-dependent glycerol-3-phosphate dehydrogenase [Pseudomonadota bacterium]